MAWKNARFAGVQYWKNTRTFPPQIMPMLAESLAFRLKASTWERPAASSSCPRCWARYSMTPPPMVPKKLPSARMAIHAPAPLGADPRLSMMVHSMAFCPWASRSRKPSTSFCISLPAFFGICNPIIACPPGRLQGLAFSRGACALGRAGGRRRLAGPLGRPNQRAAGAFGACGPLCALGAPAAPPPGPGLCNGY